MNIAHIERRYINDCGITTTTLRSSFEDFWYDVDSNWFYSEPVIAKGPGSTMIKFKKV